MNIMYKHIYLNLGVISFINKEMVTFIQLHTYKFGLVYLHFTLCLHRYFQVEKQRFTYIRHFN